MRNGIKQNARQNFLCRTYKKQFQTEYVYRACEQKNRELVMRLVCCCSSIRDCDAVSGVNHGIALKLIRKAATGIILKPKKHAYSRMHIDEQWFHVGKKKKKVWMIYALCVPKRVRYWWHRGEKETKRRKKADDDEIKEVDIETYATDHWEVFGEMLPAQSHVVGKEHTKNRRRQYLVQNKSQAAGAKNNGLFQKINLSSGNDENRYL